MSYVKGQYRKGKQAFFQNKNKYHNKITEHEGIKFHSTKEMKRYQVLKEMLDRGEITDLVLQPQFLLQEKYTTNEGIKIREINYRADFQYTEQPNGKRVVEDVKGYKTPEYKLKKKLFQYIYRDFKFIET